LFDEIVVTAELGFEIALGMKIDGHRQTLVQDHLHGSVQITEIVGGKLICMAVPEHGLRIHAEPDVIESHGLDQRDVLRRHPGFKMLFGISLGIVNLGEPVTGVDPMLQMGQTPLRHACSRSCVLRP
jgi:hypothetical protein